MSLDLSRLEKPRVCGGKTIARCPACAETGGDTAGDHLFINGDGKYGCILYQSTDGADHRKRIFELAGLADSTAKRDTSRWVALPNAPVEAPFPTLRHYKHGKPVAHWVYRTPTGETAGIVARFNLSDGKKETLPLAWCRDQHGRTDWRWKSMPDPRPLFGMPFDDDWVVVVEGEKCAEAVVKAGLPATTWAGGCPALHKTDWSPLAGKTAVIWPDNDEPGRRALASLVHILTPMVAGIKVVTIPAGMPKGWDAADTDDETIWSLVESAAEHIASEIERSVGETATLDPSDYPQPEADGDDRPSPQAKPERKPLSSFLVSHSDTISMSWAEIDALRPPYVINGFIRRGEVMLLGAESKSRKSWLAQDAGFALAAGLPWLADENGGNGFATAQARVHVLDLELNPSEMRYRFAKARGKLRRRRECQTAKPRPRSASPTSPPKASSPPVAEPRPPAATLARRRTLPSKRMSQPKESSCNRKAGPPLGQAPPGDPRRPGRGEVLSIGSGKRFTAQRNGAHDFTGTPPNSGRRGTPQLQKEAFFEDGGVCRFGPVQLLNQCLCLRDASTRVGFR